MEAILYAVAFAGGLIIGCTASHTINTPTLEAAHTACITNQGVGSFTTGAFARTVTVTCKNGANFTFDN